MTAAQTLADADPNPETRPMFSRLDTCTSMAL